MENDVSGRLGFRATTLDPAPSPIARAVMEFARNLRVGEGDLVGRRLELLEFETDFVRRALPGNRACRRAILSVARKNGKTSLVAVIVLAALLGPLSVRNAEIISAARSRDQARMLFRYACKMIVASGLERWVVIRPSRSEIFCPATGVTYHAVSADAARQHGSAPRLVVHDELGQVRGPRDDLYSALSTALGAYSDSLEIIISTQAPGDADLLSTLIDDALEADDPRTACVLYSAPMDLDPFSEEAWLAANPALGVFRSRADLEMQAETARRIPAQENGYRNLCLNQRVSTVSPWLSRSVWEACSGPVAPELFRGDHPVYAGLDLSARQDLTALVLAAEHGPTEELHVKLFAWTPAGRPGTESSLEARARQDRSHYVDWHRDGWLEAIPGESISYRWVAQRMARIGAESRIIRANYDRWRIHELQRELDEIGAGPLWPLAECGQGFRDMTPALEAVEHAAASGKLRHGGNPLLTWAVTNCVVLSDPAGNRKLDKSKAVHRIDPAVALAMAAKAARHDAEAPGLAHTGEIHFLDR